MIDAVSTERSLAACCAFLLAFIGLVHEAVGPLLYPWAPAYFGRFVWHAMGFALLGIGLVLLAGTLRLIAVPVVPLALCTSAAGFVATVAFAIARRHFHFFAFSIAVAGIGIAVLYRA